MLMFKGYKDDSLVEVPRGIPYIFHSQFAFLHTRRIHLTSRITRTQNTLLSL